MPQSEPDIFNAMEIAAIRTICLQQPQAIGQRLLEQFERASLKSREMTGVGFFTYINVPPDSVPVGEKLHAVGHLHMETEELQHGCGFVLFLKQGYLNFLECFTYDEAWPDNISYFEITSAKA